MFGPVGRVQISQGERYRTNARVVLRVLRELFGNEKSVQARGRGVQARRGDESRANVEIEDAIRRFHEASEETRDEETGERRSFGGSEPKLSSVWG